MEISFCSHSNTNKVIATKFGTWHDSWAVVACAKFCSDMITGNWIRAKWNVHRIWIVMEKSLVKWVPGPTLVQIIPWYILPIYWSNPWRYLTLQVKNECNWKRKHGQFWLTLKATIMVWKDRCKLVTYNVYSETCVNENRVSVETYKKRYFELSQSLTKFLY